ncbi:tRNA pseudouridine synthase-like 1 isoform X3 [Schistocerca americana]|uniref:tRNA pseudouridine synthase-like 1 isoform X3 n=1 Tax=Schistocerca americana TaxID=7009 RepID=UPI001F4F73D1|nr:tRNA pseudouridine synthase-like 1 isoform X3 [Schistocerca americana]XP_049958711.1 tRNA pseudouridine synthase-like 1 isoform X2 [Schistocerca serialis cubense]
MVYRAVQKQTFRTEPEVKDPESVQGILEIACRRFKPANEPKVYVSSSCGEGRGCNTQPWNVPSHPLHHVSSAAVSVAAVHVTPRTDKGVHALLSSAHVDLERHTGGGYDPECLTVGFNRYFEKAKIGLRVQKCQLVPDTFHSRHSAKCRTYLYRLAVRKQNAPTLQKMGFKYLAEIPFSEWRRCYFIQNPEFNVDAMKQAAALFPGIKDFRSFMGASRDDRDIRTVRSMKELCIKPGQQFLSDDYMPSCKHYDFWEVTCKGQSFLYRQVRRTVAALIAVAQGRLTLEDVQYMLDVPSKDSWNPKAVTVPPYGLFLVNVEYDPQDLLYERNCDNQWTENNNL